MQYNKILKQSLQLFFSLVIVFTVSGCGGGSIIIKNTAIPIEINPEECPTISVANIISSIPDEMEIGSHHTGCLNISGSSKQASVIVGFEEKIEKEIEKELIEAKYPIVSAMKTNKVFETEIAKSDILIGGIIVECKYDTYDSVCGVYSEATVTVNWKVMDQTTNSIIYEKVTIGSAEYPGNNPNSIAYAVRGSLKDILADPVFVDALLK